MLVLAAVAGLATSPDNGALQALKSKAEACIGNYADAVERADPNLSDAAAFLVDYICVSEIGAFERYKTNSALLSAMRNTASEASGWTLYPPGAGSKDQMSVLQAEAQHQMAVYAKASLDPETGEIVLPASAAPGDLSYGGFMADRDEGVMASSYFRSIAGRAVLKARQSRLAH